MLGELSNGIASPEEWVHVAESRAEAYAHSVSVACPREQALVPRQVTWTGSPQLCPGTLGTGHSHTLPISWPKTWFSTFSTAHTSKQAGRQVHSLVVMVP